MQSETAYFGPGASTWTARHKQCYMMSDWYRHLANWTKHTRRLRCRSIPSIIRKHDVVYKTGSTSHYRHKRNETTNNMYRKFGEI